MKIRLIPILAISCALFHFGLHVAQAGLIPVNLYNNDGNVADVSSALDFSVSDISSGGDIIARFTFQWDQSELTQAQLDGGIRIDKLGIVDGIFVPPTDDSNLTETGTLSFSQSTTPHGGGMLFNHALMKNATFKLQEKSNQGNSNSALDPGDILMVDLTLKSGFGYSFQTVLDYVDSGQIRVGAHVISNAGQSQVYISGPPESSDGSSPVPEPASVLLLGMGAAGLLGFRRFTGKKTDMVA